MALLQYSHAVNNPLAADYTEGDERPDGFRASSPERPPYSGPDVVGLLKKGSHEHADARASRLQM